MTLAEIKTYCTSKLGIADATALSMAELFAKQRWRTLWNEADWKQARYEQALVVASNTQDVTLDTKFDTVKAVRYSDAQELPSVSDMTAFMLDPAAYHFIGSPNNQFGTPVAFVPLGRQAVTGALQIRLIRATAQQCNLLVIGKCKPIELTTGAVDSENVQEVPIPGGSECLCEFVMGDLYEWLRQFDKAEWYQKRAAILLEKMKEIETAQASEVRRIIPTEQVLEGWGGGYDSTRPLG
jgi:hypothetical protein